MTAVTADELSTETSYPGPIKIFIIDPIISLNIIEYTALLLFLYSIYSTKFNFTIGNTPFYKLAL